MVLLDYLGCDPREGLVEMATRPMRQSGLLEKLGGVLTKGKEKLHIAGQTVKQNMDLIGWSAMYICLVGEIATVTFDMVYHPEHFGKIARSSVNLPIPLERAYAAIGAVAAGFLPVWVMGTHGLVSRRRA